MLAQQNLVANAQLHTVLGKFRLQNSLRAEEYRKQTGEEFDVDHEGAPEPFHYTLIPEPPFTVRASL
jgi:hypothetical protein